jgi:hypothetical protein
MTVVNGSRMVVNGALTVINGSMMVVNGAVTVVNGSMMVLNGAVMVVNGPMTVLHGPENGLALDVAPLSASHHLETGTHALEAGKDAVP